MRIVRTPMEIVYADNMPLLYPQGVFLKTQEYVTMKIVTGQHIPGVAIPITLLEQVARALLEVVIEALQEMRCPRQFHLDRSDLQFRIALEDSAVDHLRQRHPHPVVSVAVKGRRQLVNRREFLAWPRAVGTNVQPKRHRQILCRGPEWLVF